LGSNVPAQGNAVVFSPDESFLHVTTSNGKLVTITPSNGELVGGAFSPPPRAGWTTTCQSGIAVSDDYMVYAIIDRPPTGDFVNVAERCVRFSSWASKISVSLEWDYWATYSLTYFTDN